MFCQNPLPYGAWRVNYGVIVETLSGYIYIHQRDRTRCNQEGRILTQTRSVGSTQCAMAPNDALLHPQRVIVSGERGPLEETK